jgi:hypothetical protein
MNEQIDFEVPFGWSDDNVQSLIFDAIERFNINGIEDTQKIYLSSVYDENGSIKKVIRLLFPTNELMTFVESRTCS